MLIDFVLCNQPRKKQDLFPHSPPRHHHFLSCVLASRDPVERKHTGSCLGIDSPNQIMPPTLNGEIPRISRGARGKSWEIWNDTRKTFYDLCTRSCIKKTNVSHSSTLSGDAAVQPEPCRSKMQLRLPCCCIRWVFRGVSSCILNLPFHLTIMFCCLTFLSGLPFQQLLSYPREKQVWRHLHYLRACARANSLLK